MIPHEEIEIEQWVNQATDNTNKEFRQAVHIILSSIASDHQLKAGMILKGGILLAIRYHSHRYTKDIDLSTESSLGEQLTETSVVGALNDSLAYTVEELGYGLDCRVQSSAIDPSNESASYPTLKMKVGYAYKGTTKHGRLIGEFGSPTVVSIDYSLNEATQDIDEVKFGDDDKLLVYSLTDLIAEKYRSLLQQASRDRYRRQDIFDLFQLLETFANLDEVETSKILSALLHKSSARGITATSDSIDEPELRERASYDYESLVDEIEGELPDFDSSFEAVADFYRSLPW